VLAAAGALAACHTEATRTPTPAGPPPKPAISLDASYDWHVLLIAPLGSRLKEIPLKLHEVLLFGDSAQPAPEEAECYAPDEGTPRFAGRVPEEYLLCFKQDRLSRLRASVPLAEPNARETFAAACESWLAPGATAAPGGSAAATPGGNDCEGHDGTVRFSAHFAPEPQPALSIVIDGVSEP
jgi:hypothetical protein